MDTFPYTPFEHPSLSPSSMAAGPSSAAHAGGKRRQRRRGGGVKLSTDPQSVAARERRHRISHRFKILQSLVPGGSKMDTVSMLEEAIHYVKFLQAQIDLHHSMMPCSQEEPSASLASPATAAGATPPTALSFPCDYETHVSSSISNSTASSLLPAQQFFSYHLPPLPPLPSRPACTFHEEEELLFPCVWSVNDY